MLHIYFSALGVCVSNTIHMLRCFDCFFLLVAYFLAGAAVQSPNQLNILLCTKCIDAAVSIETTFDPGSSTQTKAWKSKIVCLAAT